MSIFPRKTLVRDFNKKFSIMHLLLWQKTVLHTTTLTPCKARQVLLDLLFSTNQGSGSEMTFAAGATKINLKNLKCVAIIDDLRQETIWRLQLYRGNYRFEPLTNSGRSLTWAYTLIALKSSS